MEHERASKSEYIDDLVNHYLTNVRVEGGLADNTVQAYRRDLEKLRAYLKVSGIDDPLEIAPNLIGFLEHLRRQHLSPASVSRCLAAIRGFYRFLSTERGAPGSSVSTSRPSQTMAKIAQDSDGIRSHGIVGVTRGSEPRRRSGFRDGGTDVRGRSSRLGIGLA